MSDIVNYSQDLMFKKVIDVQRIGFEELWLVF